MIKIFKTYRLYKPKPGDLSEDAEIAYNDMALEIYKSVDGEFDIRTTKLIIKNGLTMKDVNEWFEHQYKMLWEDEDND